MLDPPVIPSVAGVLARSFTATFATLLSHSLFNQAIALSREFAHSPHHLSTIRHAVAHLRIMHPPTHSSVHALIQLADSLTHTPMYIYPDILILRSVVPFTAHPARSCRSSRVQSLISIQSLVHLTHHRMLHSPIRP